LGKGATLDRLVLEHLPAALRFATRLSGDPQQAEEIVQEALLHVVRRFADFRQEATFRTWLFRIVINVFRDRLPTTHPAEVPLDDGRQETLNRPGTGPAEAAMAAELAERIAQEVSRLPPRQREVLVLLSVARARLKSRLAPFLGSVET